MLLKPAHDQVLEHEVLFAQAAQFNDISDLSAAMRTGFEHKIIGFPLYEVRM